MTDGEFDGRKAIPAAEFRALWAESSPYRRFIHVESGRPQLATFLAFPNGGGVLGWLMPDEDCPDLQ